MAALKRSSVVTYLMATSCNPPRTKRDVRGPMSFLTSVWMFLHLTFSIVLPTEYVSQCILQNSETRGIIE